jgi:hypothetical protein
MDWKEQQKEQVQSIRTEMPSVSVLRIAIKAMLDHWPDEVEQRDDAKSMAYMANTMQAAHEALGTAVGDDLVMACQRFREELDDLKIQLDGIHMRLSDVGFVKDEETIASNVWDLVDAWEGACKERDRLHNALIDEMGNHNKTQAALAEQMAENGRLAARVKAFEKEKEARKRHDRMCW